jgi:hypothetical protein
MHAKNYRCKVFQTQWPIRHKGYYQPVAVMDCAPSLRPADLMLGRGHHASAEVDQIGGGPKAKPFVDRRLGSTTKSHPKFGEPAPIIV